MGLLKFLKKHKTAIIITGSITVGVAAAVPVGIALVGFTPGGVLAGSIAAAWQSSIGSVASGSFFAFLQSIGTAPLTTAAFSAGGGAVIGVGTAVATAEDDSSTASSASNLGTDNTDDDSNRSNVTLNARTNVAIGPNAQQTQNDVRVSNCRLIDINITMPGVTLG